MSQTFPLCQIKDAVLKVETWNPVRDGADKLINYIDLGAIDQHTKTVNLNEPIIASSAPSRARQLVQAGDVLVSTVRPNLNGVAVVGSSLDGATASTGFCVLRPNTEKIDGSYLFHWVKTPNFISDMVRKATGASYPAVSDRIVFESKIPLPPIAQQKRIAAILDKAEELRELRRQALQKLDAIAQSTFIEMFGDPEISELATLNDACILITDGTHQTPTYSDEGVIFLSSKNVKTGEIDWENVKYIPHSLHKELHRHLSPKRNDILLAKNGTTGTAAIVDRDEIFDIYVSLALLRPKDSVNPIYLLHAINSDRTAFQFNRSLKGVGVPNLHLTEIRRATIPLPPLKRQQEFAKRIKGVEQLKTIHRESLAQLDSLFVSLQHRAFRGEL